MHCMLVYQCNGCMSHKFKIHKSSFDLLYLFLFYLWNNIKKNHLKLIRKQSRVQSFILLNIKVNDEFAFQRALCPLQLPALVGLSWMQFFRTLYEVNIQNILVQWETLNTLYFLLWWYVSKNKSQIFNYILSTFLAVHRLLSRQMLMTLCKANCQFSNWCLILLCKQWYMKNLTSQ